MAYPLDSHSAAWALEEMVLHCLRTRATRTSGAASFSSAGRFTCTADDLDTCLEGAGRARRRARLVGISRRSTGGGRARTKTSAPYAERSLAQSTAGRHRPRERYNLLILRNAAHRRLAMVVPQLLRCQVLDRRLRHPSGSSVICQQTASAGQSQLRAARHRACCGSRRHRALPISGCSPGSSDN
jgi:hypothetical protein